MLKGRQCAITAAAFFLCFDVVETVNVARQATAVATATLDVGAFSTQRELMMDGALLATQPRGQFAALYVPGRAELPWVNGSMLDGRYACQRTCFVSAAAQARCKCTQLCASSPIGSLLIIPGPSSHESQLMSRFCIAISSHF